EAEEPRGAVTAAEREQDTLRPRPLPVARELARDLSGVEAGIGLALKTEDARGGAHAEPRQQGAPLRRLGRAFELPAEQDDQVGRDAQLAPHPAAPQLLGRLPVAQ